MKYMIDDGFKLTGICMNPELRPVPHSQSFPHAECNFTLPGMEVKELFSTIGDFANEFEIKAQDGSISITGEYQSKTVEKQYEDASNISNTYECERRKFNPTITNNTSNIYQTDYVRYFMKETTEQALQSVFDIAFGNEAPLTVKRDIGAKSFIMLTTAAKQDNRYRTEN